jgi:hypothetical protein
MVQGKEQVRLAVTTGAVEVQPPGKNTWQPVTGGAVVDVGCKVRTPAQVRCEFRCSDGSEVRLNSDTELTFHSDRQLALDHGQILATVAEGQTPPFQVQMGEASVTAVGTQFDLSRQLGQVVLTVLQGATQLTVGQTKEIVKAGQGARIASGHMTEKRDVGDLELVRATRWVHEILVLKGRDNPELEKRVRDLLAQIVIEKAPYLTEEEIRGLGDHCVVPLTRFILSEQPQTPDLKARRVQAARILADLAQTWSIPDLMQMLGDSDGDVRFNAARGLKRLTMHEEGNSLEVWREQPPDKEKLAGLQVGWQGWWDRNKDRYLMASK